MIIINTKLKNLKHKHFGLGDKKLKALEANGITDILSLKEKYRTEEGRKEILEILSEEKVRKIIAIFPLRLFYSIPQLRNLIYVFIVVFVGGLISFSADIIEVVNFIYAKIAYNHNHFELEYSKPDGTSLIAYDKKGKQWRLSFSSEIIKKLDEDINNDNRKEILLGFSSEGEEHSKIIALDSQGKELWVFVKKPNYPYFGNNTGRFYVVDLKLFNTNHGLLVAAIFTDDRYYPSSLVILNTKGKKLKELWHPGYMYQVEYFKDLFVVRAVNNDLRATSISKSAYLGKSFSVIFALKYDNIYGQAPPYFGIIKNNKDFEWYLVLTQQGEEFVREFNKLSDKLSIHSISGKTFCLNEKGEIVNVSYSDDYISKYKNDEYLYKNIRDMTLIPIETFFLREIETKETQLGNDHPDVVMSLIDLARLLYLQGNYRTADSLLQRSLEIIKTKVELDASHIEILSKLAWVLRDQGKLFDAELLCRQALEIIENQVKENHPIVSSGLRRLAVILRDQEKYTGADSLFYKALNIVETHLVKNSLHTAIILNNLGKSLQAQGKYTEAEPVYRRALDICENQLGKVHAYTDTVRNNFENLLDKTIK